MGFDAGVSALVRAIGIATLAVCCTFMSAAWRTNGAATGRPPKRRRLLSIAMCCPSWQDHCQSCHRPGEVAPMPLVTCEQTRPWAGAIAHVVEMRMMPPWFADPRYGHFANDPSLSEQQIATISAWAKARHLLTPPRRAATTKVGRGMEYSSARSGREDAQAGADSGLEVRSSTPTRLSLHISLRIAGYRCREFRPGSPAHVHHAVVYIRPPDSQWLRHAPVGEPFTASMFDRSAGTAPGAWDYE